MSGMHVMEVKCTRAWTEYWGSQWGDCHTQRPEFFFLWRCDPTRVMVSSFLMFLDHTQRRTTVGRTPLDEWSARRRDLYLTTHNTHNRQTSMPPVGFEPTISAGDRLQTYALDGAVTGAGETRNYRLKILRKENFYRLKVISDLT